MAELSVTKLFERQPFGDFFLVGYRIASHSSNSDQEWIVTEFTSFENAWAVGKTQTKSCSWVGGQRGTGGGEPADVDAIGVKFSNGTGAADVFIVGR